MCSGVIVVKERKMEQTVSLASLREALLKRNANDESWADISRSYGVGVAVVWRIANEGYNPKDKDVRSKLCLPELVTREVYRNEKGRFISR